MMYYNDGEDILKDPYVSDDIIDYLDRAFNTQYFLRIMEETKNASEAVGKIKGIMEVINNLNIINEEQKGE